MNAENSSLHAETLMVHDANLINLAAALRCHKFLIKRNLIVAIIVSRLYVMVHMP